MANKQWSFTYIESKSLTNGLWLTAKYVMAAQVIELGRLRELTPKGSLASPTSITWKCTSWGNGSWIPAAVYPVLEAGLEWRNLSRRRRGISYVQVIPAKAGIQRSAILRQLPRFIEKIHKHLMERKTYHSASRGICDRSYAFLIIIPVFQHSIVPYGRHINKMPNNIIFFNELYSF